MSDPRIDCEQLMSAVMPFAEQMLSQHGEFYPFAASMSPSGECEMVALMDDELDDQPDSIELIEKFIEQFRHEVNSGGFKATAIVYDGVTVPPGKPTQQDTVICAVDHRDGFSAKVCFPYSIDGDGGLAIEEPFAAEGDGRIFGDSQ